MTISHHTPASGKHTTNGTPTGYSSITPFLAVTDPTAAIAFYSEVFGARLVNESKMGDVVAHAELEFSNGRLQLGAALDGFGVRANDPASDEVQFSLVCYVPNVDEVVQQAVARGATVREELATFVSGDRYASIRDPFGIRWTVMTRVEDLSDAESARRVKEWLASMPSE